MRWDSLLVAAAARELARELGGGRTRALHLDRGAGRVALYLRGGTAVFALHPASGGIAVAGEAAPPTGAAPLAGTVRGVWAPPDERVVVLEIMRPRGRARRVRLVLELAPGRWNALLVGGPEDRVQSVLRPRRSGGRTLLPGGRYQLPRPSPRRGCDRPLALSSWLRLLENAEPGKRAATLVRNVAYTSRLNACAFVGPAGALGSGARSSLEEGWRRWRQWRRLENMEPRLLLTSQGPQPYPYPLPGVEDGGPTTLLGALAEGLGTSPRASLVPSGVMTALKRRTGAAERKLARLREELAGLEDPARARAAGDLLLARLALIPRGADRVSLEDFEGRAIRISLDPALAPHENAALHYARAKRAERAAAALPARIGEAEARLAGWRDLSQRVAADAVDAGELERLLGVPAPDAKSRKTPARPPYRRFRSTLGTEIRVGRGARANHELTFHHSDPEDIWMHARHASGAHVILRRRGEGNPAGRDLEEAAILAALNSRSRTSASVPVDWTRRKYVRKPRGAPPGTVTMERERTVFVAPDPELAERLRVDPDAPAHGGSNPRR